MSKFQIDTNSNFGSSLGTKKIYNPSLNVGWDEFDLLNP